MNIFTRHFIHIYFLVEFEILFYIYYVMPYEKSLIYGLFKIDLVNSIIPKTNITDVFNKQCDGYNHEFDKYNEKLIMNCLYFIIFLNVVLVGIFLNDIVNIYRTYTELASSPKKRKFNSSSSLVSFGSLNNMADYKKNDDTEKPKLEIATITLEHVEDIFFIYYWKYSDFLVEINKTIQFIILVGIFEYIFFKSVVNKYKIVNSKTLMCKMLDELND